MGLAALSPLYAAECVRRGRDFRTMWGGWRLVLEGRYLFEKITVPGATPCPWPNPPSFTFFTAPFGLLSVHWAAAAWFCFKLGILVWLLLALQRFARERLAAPPNALAAPLLLSIAWLNYDFTLGHMNLVAISLMLLSLLGYLERRHVLAALCGSLAICAKGPAALLLVFFAARRRLRLAAATALLCCLWTALPSLGWGIAKTWRYNRDFVRSVQFDAIFDDVEVGWAENWSLPALVMRVLGQALPANRYGRTLQLIAWPRETASAIAIGLALLGIIGLASFWWRRQPQPRLQGFLSAELHYAALLATATLVFSPATRKAYFGTLLLPYFVLWGALRVAPRSDISNTAAVLFGLHVGLSSLTHADLFGRSLAMTFESWHVLTLSLLALFAAQLVTARLAESPAAAAAALAEGKERRPSRPGSSPGAAIAWAEPR